MQFPDITASVNTVLVNGEPELFFRLFDSSVLFIPPIDPSPAVEALTKAEERRQMARDGYQSAELSYADWQVMIEREAQRYADGEA